jgi:WD40 repeat protein
VDRFRGELASYIVQLVCFVPDHHSTRPSSTNGRAESPRSQDDPVRQNTRDLDSEKCTDALISRAQQYRNASGQPGRHDPGPPPRYLQPCAATAAIFLYAQGSTILCCHQDTLSIERRFSLHSDEIQLIAVDNQSDIGAGRWVVSYDACQSAIVWDLMTGDEVARFKSYEPLTVARWMRNGNIAFGKFSGLYIPRPPTNISIANTKGDVILFNPRTAEHVVIRTLHSLVVTALAASTDCGVFAIG